MRSRDTYVCRYSFQVLPLVTPNVIVLVVVVVAVAVVIVVVVVVVVVCLLSWVDTFI